MKKTGIVVLTTAVMLTAATGVHAGPLGAALTLQAGSLGFGVEVVKNVLPDLNARVGGNFFSYGLNQTNKDYDVQYDAKLRLQSFSLLADWHGLPGGFFLSAGAYINNNRIEASGVSTVDYTYGGSVYTPEDLGDLKVDVNFSKISPYVGLGLGNPVKEPGRIGFVLNVGTLYHNAPRVRVTATGMVEPTAKQQPDIENDVKDFRFFPVVSFGLSYSF